MIPLIQWPLPQERHHQRRRTTLFAFLSVSLSVISIHCRRPPATKPVIVYCSVDETFARSVLDDFQKRSGIHLDVLFDAEAGKTTGLVQKIIAEAQTGRGRADVFWSSELFNTILLAKRGLLESYASPAAADIPLRFKDPRHRWTALSVRARVLAFNPNRTRREDVPTRWASLADPSVAKRVAMANPLFGTTRGHVAALFALWGAQRGRDFLSQLQAGGVQIVDGNSAAVRAVMAGRADFAATDTDDVLVAQRGGATLDLVYPDMGEGGTLLIPCSVALIQGKPHDGAAQALVDFLVSAEVERMLAQSDSHNIPVRESLRRQLGMKWPAESRIDFEKIADAMDEAVSSVREILIR